jgi:hypothetical protein
VGNSSYKDKKTRDSIKQDLSQSWSLALKKAENIQDPWYKTQALCELGLHSKAPKQQLAIFDQAFAVACQCLDINRTVNVSCWPLDVLYKLGFKDEFHQQASRLLSLILQDNFSISRENGLFGLAMIAVQDPYAFPKILKHFLDACNHRHFWRGDRDCYRLALMMKQHSYKTDLINTVVDAIKNRRVRKKVKLDLSQD